MSDNHPRRPAILRRILASWYTAAALGLLLGIGLAAWVMPVRVEQVVTDAATGEARTVTTWDTSRWQAVAAVWREALLLTVALIVVLSVAWYGRSWVLAKASAARFFAASLVAHCLLLLGMCSVPLARGVVEQAEVIRVSQTGQLVEDDPQPARPGGRAAYEKLADPLAEDAVAPDLARQAAAPADVPDDRGPLAATIPGPAVRGLPPERLLFVPPRNPEVVRQPPDIERRAGARAMMPVDIKLDLPEPPPPEAAPKEQPVGDRPVAQARQEPALPMPGGPEPLPLPEPRRSRPADVRAEAAGQPRVREAEPAPGSPLLGRREPGRPAPAAPPEPAARLKAEAPPADGPPDGGRGMLPRLAPPPELPARTPDGPPGPGLPRKQPAGVAVASLPPVEVPPRLGPASDRLPRTPARGAREAKVEDLVAPPAPPLRRQDEVRQRSLKLFGGTDASEAAVGRGLDWLAAHQNADGSWGLHNFHVNCKHPRCADPGTVISYPAGTGVVLLPFLGAGHTHQAGKHRQTVARALQWLLERQRPDGTWLAPEDARPMYGHGMAAIALCEAYGMTQDPKLRGPAQMALDYIVKAQHGPSGGWRYRPNQPADTSVVGWQLMALKSGEMAGLSVPPQTFEGVKRWLASVEANRPVGGLFGYQSATATPAMTAQGLLCLQYLGARRDDPRMRAGSDYLLQHLPRPEGDTSYYWYNANQVMYHLQGKHWQAWNGKLRDLLVSTQAAQGALAGSWQPVDAREKPGGRLYATALRLLMLEVYYRHLPLYQQLEK
jgi:hypothetical protein